MLRINRMKFLWSPGMRSFTSTARLFALCVLISLAGQTAHAKSWPGFTDSSYFAEQTRMMQIDPGVRLRIIAPIAPYIEHTKPTRVVFFATPNGNTIDQTLGMQMTGGVDWHYDIQHIAAQHRLYRKANLRENLVLVCLQADIKSWPAWRKKHENNAALIRDIVAQVLDAIPLEDLTVTLASHSGGGSFMFGFINGSETIPDWIDRFIFLDSNYGYDDDDGHGDKFIRWLAGDDQRRLVVVAYDDREIRYKGKKVVSPTGGTYRATHRMLERFKREGAVNDNKIAGFDIYQVLDGRAHLLIHSNPENVILHTRMVGEMNGFLYGLALDTPEKYAHSVLRGPRAYMQWVQPLAFDRMSAEDFQEMQGMGVIGSIPPRPADAPSGRDFMLSVADMSPSEREVAIKAELLRGNIPDFLRRFVTIHTRAKVADDSEVSATFEVSPDYLSIGSDDDFVRVPMTPMTAQAVAEVFGCTLPTRKMVNDIYDQAPVKLAPLPLTEDRQSVPTFLQHNGLIKWQRDEYDMDGLVAGIKKDVVITNRLQEKPNRVAIYGWHRLNGNPIQPLYTGHVDTYVDYSHGVRLIYNTLRVADETSTIEAVLADPDLAALLSDEGVINEPRY